MLYIMEYGSFLVSVKSVEHGSFFVEFIYHGILFSSCGSCISWIVVHFLF